MRAPTDARLYQIAFLATLLSLGVWLRDFSLRPEQWLLTFASGLATQIVCVRLLGLQRVGVLSAVITCFGLSILLRADNLWVHPLAAALAIGAKFWLRIMLPPNLNWCLPLTQVTVSAHCHVLVV